jgi:hypothetical protein
VPLLRTCLRLLRELLVPTNSMSTVDGDIKSHPSINMTLERDPLFELSYLVYPATSDLCVMPRVDDL